MNPSFLISFSPSATKAMWNTRYAQSGGELLSFLISFLLFQYFGVELIDFIKTSVKIKFDLKSKPDLEYRDALFFL